MTLLASVPLMVEYEDVMVRREHLEASGLSAADVAVLLDAVAAVAEPVLIDFLWRPSARDADDDMVLDTAVNGRADVIVTFNINDLADAARRFGIDVVRPGEALRQLEKTS